ncbi:MAG: response regulator [Chlamydiae bacterium]|nr:response regulator [Chlamydiota bacterium]MBI3266798.1 response regulator [Chlamydiota bacterium]
MKQRILIVDDSPLIHQMYGAQFEEAGFEVLHAQDGIEAINAAFTQMPDLILLDINMPKINGYQVCRLLKDHRDTKTIPIIIETSKTSATPVADPKMWSFETGADGYIDKEEPMTAVDFVRPFLAKIPAKKRDDSQNKPMTETEIMTALSHLLDKQLYVNVTHLKELNERKNAFVTNVSHEFKSPLTVMKVGLEDILNEACGPTTPQQKENLERVIQTVNRLGRLVVDLLDISKIEAGKMTLNVQKVDLSELMEEVIRAYAVMVKEKKMHLIKDIPANLFVTGDKDKLMQVIINVLHNSLKYTPQKGKVMVQLKKWEKEVRLEIEDTGPGITKENLEKIFDKFVRITAEKREGTGLGLPIARDLVLLHGGKIWAESESGKGSKFVIVLPVSPAK